MRMENVSDINKTASINLCQGIFVDFVPDVYLKICQKKAQTKQLLERKQKKTGFLDDRYHWLISTRGGRQTTPAGSR